MIIQTNSKNDRTVLKSLTQTLSVLPSGTEFETWNLELVRKKTEEIMRIFLLNLVET